MSGKETKELNSNRWLESIHDLKLSYRRTLSNLRELLEECIKEMGEGAHPDEKLLKGAISDLQYSIQYMHTGRRPGNRRGVERLAGYQREVLMDPLVMQAYLNRSTAGSPVKLSDSERIMIEQALSILTEREYVCFTTVYGQAFSYAKTGEILGISKGSVDTYLRRAKKKLEVYLQKATLELSTKLVFVNKSREGA